MRIVIDVPDYASIVKDSPRSGAEMSNERRGRLKIGPALYERVVRRVAETAAFWVSDALIAEAYGPESTSGPREFCVKWDDLPRRGRRSATNRRARPWSVRYYSGDSFAYSEDGEGASLPEMFESWLARSG